MKRIHDSRSRRRATHAEPGQSRRRSTLTLLLFLVALGLAATSLSTCDPWGSLDNPGDPKASNYQGYPTVGDPSEIAVVAPADGGKLDGVQITVDKAAGATAYAIRLATSAGSLASAPLYTKTDYSANVLDLSVAPISDATTYYAQAGATVDGSLGWGKVSSFTTDFSPAATPTFSPAGGTYTANQSVTISCTTANATIYYTTDGTTPTTSSTKYTGAILVSTSETIKAIATATGYTTSAVGSASYTISYPAAATPSFSPAGGTYTADQSVTISCATSGATIYYTTDGSTPTTASTKYTSPVTVTVNPATTLEAIATAPGYTTSAIGSAVYFYSSLSIVRVAGGTFYNGTSNMTISSFHMSATDITQAQYQSITGVNPSYFGDNNLFTSNTLRPVEEVTWYDAVEFCNKLSEHDGLTEVYTITERTPSSGYPITSATVTMDRTKSGYRLPTEMEWEWAAMGGPSDSIASDFSDGVNVGGYLKGYAGSSETGGGQTYIVQYAWCYGSTTQPVGMKTANELGLYDMSGNVYQWCWDWYGEYPSGAQTDPTGASSGSFHVFRGGSWISGASYCTVSFRYSDPYYQNNSIGFRVVAP